jgi:hypothetical protein
VDAQGDAMVSHELTHLMEVQAGTVSRRQSLAHGLDDNDIERMLRRKEWARVHPGVYVDHTGPLQDRQRWWAGVLWAWPAVLYADSALLAHGVRRTWRTRGSSQGTPIHVAVAHDRRVRDRDEVKVHRVVALDSVAQWHLSPPRLRIEDAVLTACASAASPDAALALAADVCQQHRTTPPRLLRALDGGAGGRQRLRHGAELRAVLLDVTVGAMSLLEHRHLVRVERAHGLPTARRQVRPACGAVYRDAEYAELGVIVELDGRLGHEWTADRWDDMARDLLAGADGTLTIRLGWRHANEEACLTALRLGRVLQARGWTGRPRPCGPGCDVAADGSPGTSPAPGAGDVPA